MYPLLLEPIFRDYLWGGRRLQSVLGKSLPAGPHWAESWEVVDHGQEQSRIRNGPLQGITLGELRASRGRELLGRAHPQDRFPLLFKFLDCCQNLSVQVHPNDSQAARLQPPDRGKTEAWVILDSAPGAVLYAGLRQGVDQATLRRHLDQGSVRECLQPLQPRAGDCVFVPAGAAHALGEGLLVAEIQQASNTTFRLYDWDRLGPDGRPRPLHIAQSLETIDYALGPLAFQEPVVLERGVQRLAGCAYFDLQRWSGAGQRNVGGDQRCWILSILAGAADVDDAHVPGPLGVGQTVLVPASCQTRLHTNSAAIVLAMTTP